MTTRQLPAVAGPLLDEPLSGLSDDALLELMRESETARRQLEAITGEVLPPLMPATAQARAEGGLSAEHVSVIIRSIDRLPTTLPVEDITAAEQFLVEQARVFDAATLRNIARQLIDTLNPDGTLTDEQRSSDAATYLSPHSATGCTDGWPTSTPKPPP